MVDLPFPLDSGQLINLFLSTKRKSFKSNNCSLSAFEGCWDFEEFLQWRVTWEISGAHLTVEIWPCLFLYLSSRFDLILLSISLLGIHSRDESWYQCHWQWCNHIQLLLWFTSVISSCEKVDKAGTNQDNFPYLS